MEKVIVIMCDTLRAKSLPQYGNKRNTLPNLTHFIDEDFTVYKRAYAPSPWTIPSHLSFFTGLYPTEVMETPSSFRLHNNFKTLPELFKDSDYETLALISNGFISKDFGYAKGFDKFLQLWLPNPEDDEIRLEIEGNNNFEKLSALFHRLLMKENKKNIIAGIKQKIYRRFRHVFENSTPATNKAVRLLKRNILEKKSRKLFCFVNLMQTHERYNPPSYSRNRFVKRKDKYENYYKSRMVFDHYATEPFSSELLKYLNMLYEEEVLYLDLVISDLIQFLKNNSLYDTSTIVITSDHGEQFGEHGHFTHCFSVYEPVIRIPLLIKWPGESDNNHFDNKLVMLQDIYSTFLNLLDHWSPCPDSSVDLSSSKKRSWVMSQFPDMSHNIKGCRKRRQTFTIEELGLSDDFLNAYILDNGIKIIENGENMVCYDLKKDPDEMNSYPVTADNREMIEKIKQSAS